MNKIQGQREKITEFITLIEGQVNYKLDDAYRLFDYLCAHLGEEVAVERIKEEYGGEAMRVDALLFEFVQHGIVVVTRRAYLGSVGAVTMNVNNN